MNALLTLLRPFVAILAHREGPESLPASRFLLGLVIACHLAVYAVGMSVSNASNARLLGMPLIDTVAQFAFFAVLLSAMGFRARILQTLTAVFGTDVLLNGIIVPMALAHGTPDAPTPLAPLISLAIIVVMLWSLAVKGHILQRAVGFPYFVGVIIALAFAIALLTVDQVLFPVISP